MWPDSGSTLTAHRGPLPTPCSLAASFLPTQATFGPPTFSVPPSGRLHSSPAHSAPRPGVPSPCSSCHSTCTGHGPTLCWCPSHGGGQIRHQPALGAPSRQVAGAPSPQVAGARCAHSLPNTRRPGLREPQERPHPARRVREWNPEGQAIRESSVTKKRAVGSGTGKLSTEAGSLPGPAWGGWGGRR